MNTLQVCIAKSMNYAKAYILLILLFLPCVKESYKKLDRHLVYISIWKISNLGQKLHQGKSMYLLLLARTWIFSLNEKILTAVSNTLRLPEYCLLRAL